MRSFKRHILVLPLLLPSLVAGAESESYTSNYVACLETSNAMFRTMVSCMQSELARQEARLDSNLEAALLVLDKPLQKELQIDQLLWLKHREADCAQNDTEDDDKPHGFNKASCMLNMTRTRADSLEQLLDRRPPVAIGNDTDN